MINYLLASTLDLNLNICLSCIEKVFFYQNVKERIQKNNKNKNKSNKLEIEGVYERNLQNSELKIVSAIFQFFTK